MNSRLAKPTFVLFVVCTILFMLGALPGLSSIVMIAGNHVDPYQGTDLQVDYLLGVLWALVIGLSIHIWPVSASHKRGLMWVWVAKTIVTLGLMLIYEYHFGIDNDGYFTGGADWAFNGFRFGQGTHNVRQLSWLHLNYFIDSLHATKTTYSMVGFIAIYLFFRAAVEYSRKDDVRILYIIGLFPTVLFWSSFFGKDPIALFGTSLYVYGVIGWYRTQKWSKLLPLALGILISTYIRTWFAGIMLIPFIALVMISKKGLLFRLLLLGPLVAALIMAMQLLFQERNLEGTANSLIEFQSQTASGFAGNSSFDLPHIDSIGGLIAYAPIAVFTAFFRPFPWEAHNAFALLLSLENSLLLLLILWAAAKVKWNRLMDPIASWMMLFCCVWGVAYGSVIDNFGALARFKLQAMPMMVGMLLLMVDFRRGRPQRGKNQDC